MSKYMSTDSFDGAACLRRLSAELFGAGVQNGRQRSSQSIEEAAWRAGMDPDQWRAIEAGERMATRAEMSLVARGVQMSGADLATLVIFCQLLAA